MLWSHVGAPNIDSSCLSAGSSADLACRNVGQRKGSPSLARPSYRPRPLHRPPPISFFSPAVAFPWLSLLTSVCRPPATKAAIGAITTVQFKLSYTPCAQNYLVEEAKQPFSFYLKEPFLLFHFVFSHIHSPSPQKSTNLDLVWFFFFFPSFFCNQILHYNLPLNNRYCQQIWAGSLSRTLRYRIKGNDVGSRVTGLTGQVCQNVTAVLTEDLQAEVRFHFCYQNKVHVEGIINFDCTQKFWLLGAGEDEEDVVSVYNVAFYVLFFNSFNLHLWPGLCGSSISCGWRIHEEEGRDVFEEQQLIDNERLQCFDS